MSAVGNVRVAASAPATNAAALAALLSRKGAVRVAAVPPNVLDALSDGHIASVNLVEFLALDLARLAGSVALHIDLEPDAQRLADTLAMLPDLKPMKRHGQIARALYDLAATHPDRDAVAHALAAHPSDTARCWAAQWIGFAGLDLRAQLAAVRRFAADPHFGVREIAWMTVRSAVVAEPDRAIELLVPWTAEPDANLRSFASELTRPRGVGCAQIERFKTEPGRGLPLLDPLRADPSRYVQNSVANWLNDAAKSQPRWVESVCERWQAASAAPPMPATQYIVRRARRSAAAA